MSSDSFRNPHNVKTKYQANEVPSASKVTASEVERANAIHLIELAIGAIHSDIDNLPCPSIPNIARSMGDMSLLEPPIGGLIASPDTPQLSWMLKDATYNSIPHPDQKNPETVSLVATTSHRMCEVGCIHDSENDSFYDEDENLLPQSEHKCKKGYLFGNNYKTQCGTISMINGLEGVCQNMHCPDRSWLPRNINVPAEDSPSGYITDELRRYKVVFPKESRLVETPVITHGIDCGIAAGELYRVDNGPTGTSVPNSLHPEHTYGSGGTLTSHIIYTIGNNNPSNANYIPSNVNNHLIVEIPPYMNDPEILNRVLSVKVGTTEGNQDTYLGNILSESNTVSRAAFLLPSSITTSGQIWVRIEFNHSDPMNMAWLEPRVSRLWIISLTKKRHMNYGLQLELPHYLSNITRNTPFPANSIYLMDDNAGIVIENAVAYSSVFQQTYNAGTKTNIHLDNMDLYVYQGGSLSIGSNTNYRVICAGTSLTQVAGAVMSELIRHATDTNLHLSPGQICHAIYNPNVCCDSDIKIESNINDNPLWIELTHPHGSTFVGSDRKVKTYVKYRFRAVVRGVSSDFSVDWYRGVTPPSGGIQLQHITPIGNQECEVDWREEGAQCLVVTLRDNIKVDDDGKPLFTYTVFPVFAESFEPDNWRIEITSPSSTDQINPGDTITFTSISYINDIEDPIDCQVQACLCYQYRKENGDWSEDWAIHDINTSSTANRSRYTTEFTVPVSVDINGTTYDSGELSWYVGVYWEDTLGNSKNDLLSLMVGNLLLYQCKHGYHLGVFNKVAQAVTASKFMMVPTESTVSDIWSTASVDSKYPSSFGSYHPAFFDAPEYEERGIWTNTVSNGGTISYYDAANKACVIGLSSTEISGYRVVRWDRSLLMFSLDTIHTNSGFLAAAAKTSGKELRIRKATLKLNIKNVSNFGTEYSWSDPNNTNQYVENYADPKEGLAGIAVGLFIGYIFDDGFFLPFAAPTLGQGNHLDYPQYLSSYSSDDISRHPDHWDITRGWLAGHPPIEDDDYCKKNLLNWSIASPWNRLPPSVKYIDSCTHPEGIHSPGSYCTELGNDPSIGSFAYDLYSRRTHSANLGGDLQDEFSGRRWGVLPEWGMDVSGTFPGNVANIATTYDTNFNRILSPGSSIRCDITSAITSLLEQVRLFNMGNIDGTYEGGFNHLRLKIGVWLAPCWWYPTTELIDNTSIVVTGLGKRWRSYSRPWHTYDRQVELYTSYDNYPNKLPELRIEYMLV